MVVYHSKYCSMILIIVNIVGEGDDKEKKENN